ncbi:MAG: Panacea domain-containing protein [Flavobacterium sp.]|nr:Panacea domain-containing protein [Flavobacterium sp.]
MLNYLSSRIPNLSLTKVLKLLYLIDETSYQRSGTPITWLEYKAWEMGPVAEELYNELKFDQSLVHNGQILNFENYIQTNKKATEDGNTQITILPKGNYNLSSFSEFESELINNIIDRFGSYTANQLIKLLHKENTLWHQCVKDNNLDLNFKLYGKKSNHTIDFSQLIKNDAIMQMAAQSAFESMQMQDVFNEF